MTTAASASAEQQIKQLVAKFTSSKDIYTDPRRNYRESEVRSEFIDPLLEALGWDTSNKAGVIPAEREVLREESQKREDSASKKPDYTLRIKSQRKLYVEAKRPATDVTVDMTSIFQARAYGYTDGHPVVVLTNFKDVCVYDTTVQVEEGDLPETCRIFHWKYDELVDKLPAIVKVLGRESIRAVEWASQFGGKDSGQKIPADKAFIAQFNRWRIEIAEDIVANHRDISSDTLNDVVQRLLNRLIFVRMCEDRGIEGENVLKDAFAGDSANIDKLFIRLNERYNTGLFDLSQPNQEPTIFVDSELLSSIVKRLYSPYSPFSFAVLNADFLGLVYEASLAEHLVVEKTGIKVEVRLNKKLEYERRDVVTTPQALVAETVARAIEGLDPNLIDPDVLDFAAGSGRFLLSAFDQLLVRYTARLVDDNSTKLAKIGPNEWRLPFTEKCSFLTENFFGIDVDYNAVEVARFSLLVRLLEDESEETLPRTRKLLPNLTNILSTATLLFERSRKQRTHSASSQCPSICWQPRCRQNLT